MDKILPHCPKDNGLMVDDDMPAQETGEAFERTRDELEESLRRQNADLVRANEKMLVSEGNLKERLKFETLLAELSAHFVNLPAGQIDSAIQDAQRRMCEFLDLDRATLWQVQKQESGMMQLTHLHQPPESTPPAERMKGEDFFPWTMGKVLAGKTVVIEKMTDLPPEASQDRESYRLYGSKSALVVPLSVGGGKVFGVQTFAVTCTERKWTETIVKGFHLIVEVFANALARRQAETALRENEERLRIATNAAGAALWSMEIETGAIWCSEKARELFHFAPDEALNYERFLEGIHPEDCERVHQAVQQAIHSAENLRCDYRIILPDRKICWIIARGQRHLRSDGESDRLMGVSLDITERKRREQELEERLRFETLLTEISTRFVNMPADRIDGEIEDVLSRICKLLDLDLSAIWQWSDEAQGLFTLTHIYSAQDGPQPSEVNQEHFPWLLQQILSGRIVTVSSLEELPAEAARDLESCRLLGIKSKLILPLSVGDGPPVGILGLNTTQAECDWPDELVKRLQLIAQILTNALERKRMEGQLRKHLQEIEDLKGRLEQENIYLKEEVKNLVEHKDIVGKSLAMRKLLSKAEQVSGTDSTVFLLGETGTGKELLARAIHSMSLRKDRPLVTVNCASLPPALIESELFGREKGAYTGAMTQMIGRFEIADGSTLFLDEIGELPIDLQSKLLRVLEEGSFERLGSTRPLNVNVRIIAATNRDVEQEVKDGKFRRDLFYRLNVFPIVIPPLSERSEDIPLLVRRFVKEFQKKMGKEIESIPKKTIQTLQSYSWPGNVRELRNVIEHAMILSKGKTLDVHLPDRASFESNVTSNLEDVDRRHIVDVLKNTGWRIAGPGGAAEILGLKRTTLQTKMKKLGINRPGKSMPG